MSTDIVQPMRFEIDLDSGLVNRPQRAILMKGDRSANRIIVALTKGGAEADLEGVTVTGTFARPGDGAKIVLDGEADGNEARVLLRDECYEAEGLYEATVDLTKGETSRTILKINGHVQRTGSDEYVEITGVIPSVEDIVAQYGTMLQVTQDAKDATEEVRTALGDVSTKEIAAIREAGSEEVAAIAAANAAAQTDIENKKTAALAEIPETYTDLSNTVTQLKESKADGISDSSARAASHEIYAQVAPLGVTVFGATTETGSGDKSPDNPYTITGLDAVRVQASGRNIYDPSNPISLTYSTVDDDGWITATFDNTDGSSAKFADCFTSALVGLQQDQSLIVIVEIGRGTAYTGNVFIAMGGHDAAQVNQASIRTPTAGETYKMSVSCVNPNASYSLRQFVQFSSGGSGTVVYRISVLLADKDNYTYEPYNANIKEIGTILPDGAPLYGNGTVDDTVELNVASGCDCCVTFEDATDLTLADFDATANVVYSDTTAGIAVTDGVITSTLAYPCTVYYRSTAYTPENDLRVCRTVRRLNKVDFNSNETWKALVEGDITYFQLALSDAVASAGYHLRCSRFNVKHSFGRGNAYIAPTSVGPVLIIVPNDETLNTLDAWGTLLSEWDADGKPLSIEYQLATPEIYYSDAKEVALYPPYGVKPVTVLGSGETAVEYIHDTKHYIDQKFDALAAAILT